MVYAIIAAATGDFTIVTDSEKTALELLKQLNEHFITVDLGNISWPLGMSITRDHKARTISLGQTSKHTSIKLPNVLDSRTLALLPHLWNPEY